MTPTLSLARLGPLQRISASAKFLPYAWKTIEKRHVSRPPSFRIRWLSGTLRGLSAGDVSLSTSDDLSELKQLVVHLEDRRFFRHPGIDVAGLLRATLKNIVAFRIVQGGSTITQQLVRNTLIAPDRSWLRKALEIVLALKLERHFSKAEILDLYCRNVVLGPGVRGFSAAARVIYRRPIAALSKDDLYGLVGLLRTPSRSFPSQDSHRFEARQQTVARILEPGRTGRIKGHPVRPIPVWRLRLQRPTQVVVRDLRRSGIDAHDLIDVTTTTVSSVQSALDATLREASGDRLFRHVAGVVVDTRDASLVAESAWSDSRPSEFSPALSGRIQPGSTFKTFAMLAALEQGFRSDLPLESAPFESSFLTGRPGAPWRVRNYAHRYRGVLSLREALCASDNTAFARLVELLDLRLVGAVYSRFGLAATRRVSPSIVLGAVPGGVSLVQLAAAYAALARNGVFLPVHAVRAAVLADGALWTRQAASGRVVVVDANHVRAVHDALVVAAGKLAALGMAGKTGTTATGTLFAGYSRELSVALWGEYRTAPSEEQSKHLTAIQMAARFARRVLGPGRAFSI